MRGSQARKPSRSTVRSGPWGAAQPSVSANPPTCLNTAGVLSFSYNPEISSVISSSANAREVLGVSQQHLAIHGALFLAYVHPADRFTIEVQLDTALRDGTPYVATYRWIRPDTNEVRFIHCRASLDPSSNLFSGIIIDITPEASKLRAEGDLPLAIGDLLQHLSLPGITLDPEFTIRSVSTAAQLHPISCGVADLDYEKVLPGASLPDCFTSDTSKKYIHSLLEKAILPQSDTVQFAVDGFQTIIRPLLFHGIHQGIVLYTLDRREEQAARNHAAMLERELQQLNAISTSRLTITAATQEIAGYSALITRHSRGNPLLGAISDSLFQSVRELAATTDQLNAPSGAPLPPKVASRSRKRRSTTDCANRQTTSAQVIFASDSPRCATSHALLLRESGLLCATADIDENTLISLIRSSKNVHVVVLDAAMREAGIASLVRRLKRIAPRIHIVCLATNDQGAHLALLRAGAVALLTKPATAREIEHAVKTLLGLRIP